MKKHIVIRTALIALMAISSITLYGQNISVTFTGTGAAAQIDSVKATNLRTKQWVTFHGNDTLVLSINTGISEAAETTGTINLFPNPFFGQATVRARLQYAQTVQLKILNLVGQTVSHVQTLVQAGNNDFTLSVSTAGIYLVTIQSEQGITSFRAVCSETTGVGNQIRFIGAAENPYPGNHSVFKTAQTSYTLGYTPGDIILYRCRSGVYTTIVTDSPVESKNFEVEFVPCTDPDGRNYSIVKIGEQTWMAENMAYLPSVNPSSNGSDSSPFYYVYGYEGKSIGEAIGTANYGTYGVLYNWEAAKTVCPSGWLLPIIGKWAKLINYLTFNGYGYDGSGSDFAKSLASSYGWNSYQRPGTIGNDQGSNNRSGFSALPGGYRHRDGGFFDIGDNTRLWESTESGASTAFSRSLIFWNDGMSLGNNYRRYGFSVRCVKGVDLMPPTVTTISPITEITQTTAKGGGNVTNDGGDLVNARGLCWSTSPSPTINNSKTSDGTGTGSFNSYLTGLTAGTLYYVRAYATNLIGTAYGEEVSFRAANVTGNFTDSRDNKTYSWVKIGTQTWMAENLAFLPSVSPSADGSVTSAFYYVYGYQGSSVNEAIISENYKQYGVLYNWTAAMNGESASSLVPSGVQGSCPAGWHLPSDAEWTMMTDYLGSSAGMKIKATIGWSSGNGENISGFNALPGGRTLESGSFYGLYNYAYFWSSSLGGSSDANCRSLDHGNDRVDGGFVSRSFGFSVRCLKDD